MPALPLNAMATIGAGWNTSDKDLRRQRDLERLGWRFVRIFESDYYLDKQAQLEKIWRALDDMGITPHHIHNEVDPSDSIMVLSGPM